jgi:EAL domain-containing protein (putative c-di-GMP-specific phosphodiesterase class I)
VRANAEADTVIDERTLAVEVRCGVAYAEPGDDAEALLRRADSALQSARRGQGMVVAHDAAMADRRRAQVELAADLRRALDDDLLEVHFQPIVDLADRAVQRAEALVRWHHPERGDVPPTEFVGIAERSGLIHRLTATVLDLALERCAGRLGLGVNVNVSALDATSDLLIAQTEAALGRHGIAPEMLCLEITESARLEEEPATIERLRRLTAMGVKVAIDDFGTGWSSFTLLERLPAAQLKLDRAFVGRMCADGRSAAIVRSAVTLAQALGLEIVAEGIEDQATREALTALGCRYGQGFLFAPAMPVDGLAGFVKNGR